MVVYFKCNKLNWKAKYKKKCLKNESIKQRYTEKKFRDIFEYVGSYGDVIFDKVSEYCGNLPLQYSFCN